MTSLQPDNIDPITQKYNVSIKRFENIFQSGENVAGAPNPKNAQEVLVLNSNRLRMWARDWVCMTVVDIWVNILVVLTVF